MKRWAVLFLGITSFALYSKAEPRWCAVSEKDPSNTLVYPPIARAARVSGIAVMRLIYTPNGRVLRTEPVFGPVMLANSVTNQVMTWTVKTNAAGDEHCMTLMIAEFRFLDPDEAPGAIPMRVTVPAILRISVEERPIILSDPAADITWSPFKAFAFKVRTLAHHLLHRSR